MGAIVGFILGYALGTQAGERGWSVLLDSWERISSSEEVKTLLTEALGKAPELLRQGAGVLVESLGQSSKKG